MFGFLKRLRRNPVARPVMDLDRQQSDIAMEEAAPIIADAVAADAVAADAAVEQNPVAVERVALEWASIHRLHAIEGEPPRLLVRAHYAVTDADGDTRGKDIEILGPGSQMLAEAFLDLEETVHQIRARKAQRIARGVHNP